MPDPELLTAADIARLAGVTRATVSNWRRRHADFPGPAGGTAASPAYARPDVEDWLAGRGALPELTAAERLWRSVRAAAGNGGSLADVTTQAADFLRKARQTGSPAPTSSSLPRGLMRTLTESSRELSWSQALDALITGYAASTGALDAATPEPVAELMTALASPGAGDVVLDPAVGTGALLFSARKYDVLRMLGQDLDISVAALAARRYAENADSAETVLRTGDSLREDQFADASADIVLCHPPFGVQDWGLDDLADDARWQYGTPPRSEGELAWVEHSLAHLRPGGRAVLLMPPAAASRPSGRRVRAELVRRGALRGVVSLPPGAVEPRHISVHIWVLERSVEGLPDPHLLLMDTRHLGTNWPSVADQIQKIWATFRDNDGSDKGAEPGFWRTIAAIELLDDAIDITPARHVGTAVEAWSAQRTAAEIQALRISLREKIGEISACHLADDWELRDQGRRWRTADITDLGHWNAVTFYRSSTAAPPDQDLAGNLGMAGDQEKSTGMPVLRVSDVEKGDPPSGMTPEGPMRPGWVLIQQGDVIIPAAAADRGRARVAEREDEGAVLGRGLHLIRPDPDRLDPWFLNGFLSSPLNVQQASAGSTGSRIDVRRLVIPVIPLKDQRRYGAEFRELHGLEATSRDLALLAERISRLLGDNLAAGRLKPRAPDSEPVQTPIYDPGGDEEGRA